MTIELLYVILKIVTYKIKCMLNYLLSKINRKIILLDAEVEKFMVSIKKWLKV